MEDDRLVTQIEHQIRANIGKMYIESLKVERLQDGSIKLSGKMGSELAKKEAQMHAEYEHLDEVGVPPNKVINEIVVTGREER